MTLETIFITQIASVLAFIVTLFILYRVLVSAKNATIETLKQQVILNEQKISDYENQEPDVLLQRLTRRTEYLENELRLYEQNEESNKEHEKQSFENQKKALLKQIEDNKKLAHEIRNKIERAENASAAIRKHLLKMYDCSCQVCGLKNEAIMQLSHIKPYFMGGESSINNTLLLCPNDHSLFDKGLIGVDESLGLIGKPGHLNIHQEHDISKELLMWHRSTVLKII